MAVPQQRVAALSNFDLPGTKKGLKRYCRRFVDGFADLSACLSPATHQNAEVRVRWTEGMKEAFASLCKSLCDCVCLHVPTGRENFVLYTDASAKAMGGCLHMICDDQELPVGFYSRPSTKIAKYSTGP